MKILQFDKDKNKVKVVDPISKVEMYITESNAREILQMYSDEEEIKRENAIDKFVNSKSYDTYVILITSGDNYYERGPKAELHAFDSTAFESVDDFITMLGDYYKQVRPYDYLESSEVTFKSFEEAEAFIKLNKITFQHGIEYEKKWFGCYGKNVTYQGTIERLDVL